MVALSIRVRRSATVIAPLVTGNGNLPFWRPASLASLLLATPVLAAPNRLHQPLAKALRQLYSSASISRPCDFGAPEFFDGENGEKKIGQWLIEEVDILDDYKRACGKEPPPVASIAVMNDSDNTGEKSIAYLNYIKVYRRE